MAAFAQFQISSRMAPASTPGTGSRQEFAPSAESVVITAETDTIAQIILTPEDFVAGSGTEPSVEMDLKDLSGPGSIIVVVTPGGGGENIEVNIVERVAGVSNDFDKVRGLQFRALPVDGSNPSKIKAVATFGDLTANAWDRLLIPVGYDSSESGRSALSDSAAAIPRGLAYSETYPLKVIFYEVLNARVLITLLGN